MGRETDPDSDLGALDALVLECLEAETDACQSVVERLCRDHPEHADDLRRRLGLLQEQGLVGSGEDRGRNAAPVPEQLGGYRIVRRLGGGGMGTVYLAEDLKLGRRVALKVVHPERLLQQEARARFEREAQLVSRIDHPAICPLYEFGEDRGVPFLAMRFVEGETLAARIAAARSSATRGQHPHGYSTNRTELLEAVRLLEEVARALHTAHELGLVHLRSSVFQLLGAAAVPGQIVSLPAAESLAAEST